MKSKHRLDSPSANPAADSIFVFLQYNFPFAWPLLPSRRVASIPLFPSTRLLAPLSSSSFRRKPAFLSQRVFVLLVCVDMCCIILKYFDTRKRNASGDELRLCYCGLLRLKCLGHRKAPLRLDQEQD